MPLFCGDPEIGAFFLASSSFAPGILLGILPAAVTQWCGVGGGTGVFIIICVCINGAVVVYCFSLSSLF